MAEKTTANQEMREPRVVWDDREMETSYANVVNVGMGNDEVMILFGTSNAWSNVQREINIKLVHRIILTKATARRLQELLARTLEESV